MGNKSADQDPFEQFRREKEHESTSEDGGGQQPDERDDRGGSRDEAEERAEDGEKGLFDIFVEHTEQEGRPEGFWTHRMRVELDEQERRELLKKSPRKFTSHEVSPENRDAEDDFPGEDETPEGFSSHRWDLEKDEEEENETEARNAPDEDDSGDRA